MTNSSAELDRSPASVGPPGSRAAALAAAGYPVTMGLAVLTCALAPTYVLRWHLGSLPTTVLENALLLTVAAFIVELWRAGTWPPWRNWPAAIGPAWRTSLTIPTALFLVAGAISVVVAPDRRAALGLYRAYLIEPILFSIVVLSVVTSAQRAAAIVGGLAAGATVAGVANAVVVLVALSHRDYNVLNTPPVVIYNTANAVALYLVPVIAVAGAIALHWPTRRERLLAAGFVAVGTICVLLSFSRGGYLALAGVAIGLAISHRRRWLLLAGAAVAAGILLLIPPIRRRVWGEIDLNGPNNTLVGRFHLWSATLQMLKDHPIFGAGLSGYATVLGPYWNPYHPDRFTYPHNIVLSAWSETGLLGLIAFAWLMVAGFVRSIRGWRFGAPGWRVIQLGVALALVAVLLHGLVDVPYWKNDLSLEFWALLSLTFAPAGESPRQPS
jgi:putative inorganic carbon (hco3(-)) transporter